MPGPLSSCEVEHQSGGWDLSNDFVTSLDLQALAEGPARDEPRLLSIPVSGLGGVLEFEPDVRASGQSLNTPAR